jgi:hypothetical protein
MTTNTPPEAPMRVDWSKLMSSLYEKREALQQVIVGLEKLFADGTLQIETPTAAPVPALAPAPQTVSKNRKSASKGVKHSGQLANLRKSPKSVNRCATHPDNRDFDERGRCRICCREYASEYWRKKRKAKLAADRQPKVVDPGVGAGEQRCTKCKQVKRIDEFDRRGRGHRPDCKQCRHDEKGTGKPIGKRRARKIPRQNEANRPSRDVESTPHIHDEDDEDPDPEDLDLMDEDVEVDEEEEAPKPVEAVDFVYSKPTRCSKCGMDFIRLQRKRDANLEVDHWLHVRRGQQPCTLKISHYKIPVDARYQPAAATGIA